MRNYEATHLVLTICSTAFIHLNLKHFKQWSPQHFYSCTTATDNRIFYTMSAKSKSTNGRQSRAPVSDASVVSATRKMKCCIIFEQRSSKFFQTPGIFWRWHNERHNQQRWRIDCVRAEIITFKEKPQKYSRLLSAGPSDRREQFRSPSLLQK